MASSSSSREEPEDNSGLQARVESLEQTVAEQERALDELRTEVRRLRAALNEADDSRSQRQQATGGAEEGAGGESGTEEGDGDERPSRELRSARGTESEGAGSGKHAVATAPSAGSRKGAGPRASGLLERLESWARLRSEDWLSYVGIGLLLFGLAFLFKYSVERGWLVPVVRVGFGGGLGSVLLWAGLRVYHTRRRLRQVLLGGSSATFYATVFAAYQLYGLISYPVAFASMGLVTVGTIVLAVQQDESSLAIIGTIGGLGTPFLLYSQVGSVGGLAAYICVVLAGACTIFLVRGWRPLLYTTVIGGWIVLFVVAFRAGVIGPRPPDVWALQGGIAVSWGLLAGTPVLRVLLHERDPDRWPVSPLPDWIQGLVGTDRPAYGLVLVSPFLALWSSRLLWSAADEVWALVAGVGALLYAGGHVGLRRTALPRYAPVHGLVAAVLAAYGLSQALDGSALLVAWGVEVLLLHELARRLDEDTLQWAGHGLFVVLSLGLADDLAQISPEAVRFLRPSVLSELVVLALVGAASFRVPRRWARWTYRGLLLAGWLAWWAGELAPLPNGTAYLLVVSAGTATGIAASTSWLEDDQPVRFATHLLFAILAGVLAVQFGRADITDPVLVSLPALSRMVVLGLALGAAHYLRGAGLRTTYWGVVLAGWLTWWLCELAPLVDGHAYVSAVWGATAAALLIGGAWAGRRAVQFGGLATLGLFVAKLFLVDLASLSALWRIALFLGSGAAFLGVSYLLPGLAVGQSGEESTEEPSVSATEGTAEG